MNSPGRRRQLDRGRELVLRLGQDDETPSHRRARRFRIRAQTSLHSGAGVPRFRAASTRRSSSASRSPTARPMREGYLDTNSHARRATLATRNVRHFQDLDPLASTLLGGGPEPWNRPDRPSGSRDASAMSPTLRPDSSICLALPKFRLSGGAAFQNLPSQRPDVTEMEQSITTRAAPCTMTAGPS
jgi:hypothetical protein